MRTKVKLMSKLIVVAGIICMCITNSAVFAGERNEDAFSYEFLYGEYGEGISIYSDPSQKGTKNPVYAYCESATSTFSVVLVACQYDSEQLSSGKIVSGAYYLSTGTNCSIVNTALTEEPNRAWVGLKGIYQGDYFVTGLKGIV